MYKQRVPCLHRCNKQQMYRTVRQPRYYIASCIRCVLKINVPKNPYNNYTTVQRVLYGVYTPTDLCKLFYGFCVYIQTIYV